LIKNPVVVSLGDPSGIGTEVFLKAVFETNLKEYTELITVVASKKLLSSIAQKLNYQNIESLNIVEVELDSEFILGKPNIKNGSYVIKCLNKASDICYEEKKSLVTGPINKKIITNKISNFSGHTEFLQKKYSCNDVLMLLTNNLLKIGVATTHVALKDVSKMITKDLIMSKLKLLEQGLTNIFRIKKPKIAILGLNPHAGEAGSYGSEEIEHIQPAIEELNNQGLNLIGPISADTAFIENKYDAYLSMYHDQALPVLKTLDFYHSVNITLGLPFTRVSVDHGTAEDIAMDLVADYTSMLEALKLAGNGDSI
tara:strand:- start:14081 stop:15016 length:936 start_codon:yes stop_codon:yes gene_type:complete